MTRRLGRRFAKPLDRAGAEIYEYQPSMIHAKLMTIDGLWTIAGSTNFDHRSFDLNDEDNIAISDRGIASQIDDDFANDLRQSRRVNLGRLQRAGVADHIVQDVGYVIRREE